MSDKKRLTLEDFEYEELMRMVNYYIEQSEEIKRKNKRRKNKVEELYVSNDLIDKLSSPVSIKRSVNKGMAMMKATEARSNLTKEKVYKAIDKLKSEDKSITAYTVSKEANVSFNSAKKYLLILDVDN